MFGYAVVKKKILARLENEHRDMTEQMAVAQSMARHFQKREWALAVEKAKSTADRALTQDLLSLAENLKEFWAEEENSNWKNIGIHEINKVINQDHRDLNQFGEAILLHVARYVNAYQGALFVANDNSSDNIFLETIGCYACRQEQRGAKKIAVGEGLIGECYTEGATVYLTNIPKNYLKITSGLGESSPQCIVILSLNAPQKKTGVLELAFLRLLKPHEHQFLISLGEPIANAILSIQSSNKTKELLSRSESFAAEMKKSQEELRHHVEEMRAIQDDLSQKNEALEKARQDMEALAKREKELIESQLSTQEAIKDKIIETLKSKIVKLQGDLKNYAVSPIRI